jgi:hypothetical protein
MRDYNRLTPRVEIAEGIEDWEEEIREKYCIDDFDYEDYD